MPQVTVAETRLTLTTANTQYSITLNAQTRYVEFYCTTAAAIRWSFIDGRVVAGTSSSTLAANAVYDSPRIQPNVVNDNDAKLYFAGGSDGLAVQITEYR